MPEGYEEVIGSDRVVFQVPLSVYPDTYNGHPLWYVALVLQKSYVSLHFMPVYGDPVLLQRLTDGFQAAGKTLNMGKACIRFKRADDLALDVVADLVASIPMNRWIDIAKAASRR